MFPQPDTPALGCGKWSCSWGTSVWREEPQGAQRVGGVTARTGEVRQGGFKEVAAEEMQSSETPPPGEELSRAFHVGSTKKETSVFITAAAPVLRAFDIRCGLNVYF